jgi:hypothetical protein
MSGLRAPVVWGAFLAAVPLPRSVRQGTGGPAEGPLSVPAEARFGGGPTTGLYHGAAR